MRPGPGPSIAWLILLASISCTSHLPPQSTLPPGGPEELPDDFPSLLSLASNAYRPYGPVESVQRSLEAARKALELQPGNELASFLAARSASWLLEFDQDLAKDQALSIARTGLADAETALASGGEKVEYVFMTGALLGQELKLGSSPGLAKMRRVLDYFERAVQLDPSFQYGSPLRALGTLLVKAPPWPTGVGDDERGLELLEQGAEEFPGFPASHLYLADAQASTATRADAANSYERVLVLCEEPRWGSVCETYEPRAQSALAKLR